MKIKYKNLLFYAATAISTSHGANIFYDNGGADTEFLTAANWVGDVLPGASDRAGINGGNSLDHSSGTANVNEVFIQNGDGTSTMNFSGGTVNSNLTQIGGNDITATVDAIGILNLSAGSFSTATTFIGANNFAIGVFNISGGSFSATNITIDNAADTQGTLNISGIADISANNLTLNDNADLSFALTSSGVSDIDLTGAFNVDADADLSINASAYTGGAGTIELVQFGSNTGTTWNTAAITGLAPGLTGNIVFDSDSMNLVIVPEPSSALLLSIAGLGLISRRKRG